jgi:hypothetical protein
MVIGRVLDYTVRCVSIDDDFENVSAFCVCVAVCVCRSECVGVCNGYSPLRGLKRYPPTGNSAFWRWRNSKHRLLLDDGVYAFDEGQYSVSLKRSTGN